MKKIMQAFSLGLLFSLLAACGQPSLDTTNDEALKASVQSIMAELPAEERERFKKTLQGLYVLGGMAALSRDITPEQARKKMDEKLHGKTADEIFALAAEIRQKMQQKRG